MKPQALWIIAVLILSLFSTNSTAQPSEDVRYLTIDHAESHDNDFFDLDGDGDMDIISINRDYAQLSLVWFEQVDGQFLIHVIKDDFASYLETQFVDYDQDGDIDIVFFEDFSPYTTILWIENEAGTFLPEEVLINNVNQGSDFYALDVDEDGDTDLFTNSFSENEFGWYENQGDDQFGDFQIIESGLEDASRIFAWDVDQDGDIDPITNRNNTLIWYPVDNSNGVTFGDPIDIGYARAAAQLDTLDFDLDGDMDFCANTVGANLSLDRILLFENQGDGQSFIRHIVSGMYKASGATGVDIDQDGYPDIVGCGFYNGRTVWYRNRFGEGQGADFASGVLIDDQVDDSWHVSAGDVNGDGFPDLLSTGAEGLNLQINDGNGGFEEQTISSRIRLLSAFDVGDFDLDERIDIIAAGVVSPNVGLWLNDGDTDPIFGDMIATDVLGNTVVAEAADINDDGLLEFVLGNQIVGGVQEIRFDTAQHIFTQEEPEYFDWCCDYPTFLKVMDFDENNRLQYAYQIEDPEQYIFTADDIFFSQIINKVEQWQLDNEGKKELVVANHQGLIWFTPSDFGADTVDPNFIDDRGHVSDFLSGDWNNDGMRDFLAVYPELGEVVMYLTDNSATTFTTISLGDYYPDVRAIIATDINDDGLEDFLLGSEDKILLITQVAELEFALPELIAANLAERIDQLKMADLDGDGQAEVIFASKGDDRLGYLTPSTTGFLLRAYCFLDENENGLADEDEFPLPNRRVAIVETGQQAFSTNAGLLQFYLPEGESNVDVPEQYPWEVVGASTISVQAPEDLSEPLAIPFRPTAIIQELDVHVMTGVNRCFSTPHIWISAQNTGTTVEDVVVSLTLEGFIDVIDFTPDFDSIVGSTYYWTISELPPSQSGSITGTLVMPDEMTTGNDVIYLAEGRLQIDGEWTSVAEDEFATTVRCAYDPNDKLAVPDRGEPDFVLFPGEDITYTIRFQNTGNDTAFQVRLEDQLDPSLDWNSITLIAASHDYQLEINDAGLLTVLFPDINLPDSTCCWAASQGFITFAVDPLADLSIGTQIENTAGIFFDFNSPIITNTTVHRLTAPNNIVEVGGEAPRILLFPNPTQGLLTIRIDSAEPAELGALNYRVSTIDGKVVRKGSLRHWADQENTNVDFTGLPLGTYVLTVLRQKDGSIVGSKKVIKQ
mgnify:CR=1 FL=1